MSTMLGAAGPTLSVAAQSDRRQLSARRLLAAAVSLTVGLLFAAALAARCVALENLPGFNGDEAWMGLQAEQLWHGQDPAWRTPTGNPLNPLYVGPLVLLHAVAQPSPALVRWPACASGILACAVAWWLGRRVLGHTAALILALFLAVLPVAIGYSRFGWDTAQTPLTTLWTILSACLAAQPGSNVRRWSWSAVIGFVAAMLVHPTNLFVLPLLACIALAGLQLRRPDLLAPWRSWRRLLPLMSAGLTLALLAAVTHGGVRERLRKRFLPRTPAAVHLETAETPLGHDPHLAAPVVDLEEPTFLVQAAGFCKLLPRLFSGVTVVQFLTGACPDTGPGSLVTRWFDGIFALLLLLVAACWWRHWRGLSAEQRPLDAALMVGWLLMLIMFFVVAGPESISPHYERYALCFIAPTGLLASRALGWLTTRPGWRGGMATGGLLLFAGAWLAAFCGLYFGFQQRTGGESHHAFRTAAVDPKVALLAALDEERENRWLVCGDWWSELPLKYLAFRKPQVRVSDWETAQADPAFARALALGQVRFVAYVCDPPQYLATRDVVAQLGGVQDVEFFDDFSGRHVLALLTPADSVAEEARPAGRKTAAACTEHPVR